MGEANQPPVTKTATKSRPATRTRSSSANGTARRTPTRPNGKALSTYITERFDEFSRSQKDVARYIVDHLDEAAFQTAEELARRADTSSSTVVRFSQALGFEGYPELQQAAIEEYRSRGPAETGNSTAPLFDFDHSEFEASLAADHANVEETVRNLTREQVEACVTALGSAHRVMIVGMDQLAFFASYLRHLLALLDIRAEVVASPRQDSITRLSRVDEDSLVIAFSAGRAHPIVVRAMKLAKHRGASTMAITDATLSDIGQHSDLTLYYSSNGPSFTRSNTSLLAIVQALAYGVYARDKGAYKDRIRAFKLKHNSRHVLRSRSNKLSAATPADFFLCFRVRACAVGGCASRALGKFLPCKRSCRRRAEPEAERRAFYGRWRRRPRRPPPGCRARTPNPALRSADSPSRRSPSWPALPGRWPRGRARARRASSSTRFGSSRTGFARSSRTRTPPSTR